jgi:hypothetical protein
MPVLPSLSYTNFLVIVGIVTVVRAVGPRLRKKVLQELVWVELPTLITLLMDTGHVSTIKPILIKPDIVVEIFGTTKVQIGLVETKC